MAPKQVAELNKPNASICHEQDTVNKPVVNCYVIVPWHTIVDTWFHTRLNQLNTLLLWSSNLLMLCVSMFCHNVLHLGLGLQPVDTSEQEKDGALYVNAAVSWLFSSAHCLLFCPILLVWQFKLTPNSSSKVPPSFHLVYYLRLK